MVDYMTIIRRYRQWLKEIISIKEGKKIETT
jgi:hypothetical protein